VTSSASRTLAARVATVPSTTRCRGRLAQWMARAGVSAGRPWAISVDSSPSSFRSPMNTTSVGEAVASLAQSWLLSGLSGDSVPVRKVTLLASSRWVREKPP
jgi:hypothetical protein